MSIAKEVCDDEMQQNVISTVNVDPIEKVETRCYGFVR